MHGAIKWRRCSDAKIDDFHQKSAIFNKKNLENRKKTSKNDLSEATFAFFEEAKNTLN